MGGNRRNSAEKMQNNQLEMIENQHAMKVQLSAIEQKQMTILDSLEDGFSKMDATSSASPTRPKSITMQPKCIPIQSICIPIPPEHVIQTLYN